MKKVFWLILIFTFLFSLTGLFAQEKATVKVTDENAKVTTQKVGKKVSEMPQVTAKKEVDKAAVKEQRDKDEQEFPQVSSKSNKPVNKVQKKSSERE